MGGFLAAAGWQPYARYATTSRRAQHHSLTEPDQLLGWRWHSDRGAARPL